MTPCIETKSIKKYLSVWAAVIVLFSACNAEQKINQMSADELKKEAVDTLRRVLYEQQEWVKVHAAEFLIWSGNPEGVKDVYLKEQEAFVDKPKYRIGIWRVLAQLNTGDEKQKYQQQIIDAFIDTAGDDRVHAVETMAKLKLSPLPDHSVIAEHTLRSDVKSLSAYTKWSIAYTNEAAMKKAKQDFLESILDENEEELPKRIAAYVLRNSGVLEEAQWQKLSQFVLQLPDEASTRLSFTNAALLTASAILHKSAEFQQLKTIFYSYQSKAEKAVRIDMAAGMAELGTESDLPLLLEWLHNKKPTGNTADDADVQASAAYAILKMVK